MTRVTICGPNGERLLDTLVGEQNMPPDTVVAAPREGIRKQMLNLAQEIGPSLTDVRAVFMHFARGKSLIGYHMPLKLQDMGLLNLVVLPHTHVMQRIAIEKDKNLSNDIIASKFDEPIKQERSVLMQRMATPKYIGLIKFEDLYDTAKIYNRNSKTQTQIPVDILCQSELNLAYSKRGKAPYAYSEAKISMALYMRWLDLKAGLSSAMRPVKSSASDEKENIEPKWP